MTVFDSAFDSAFFAGVRSSRGFEIYKRRYQFQYGPSKNPFKPGTDDHDAWTRSYEAGRRFAEQLRSEHA